MKTFVLILSAIILTWISPVAAQPSDQTITTITGTVKDAASHKAVQSAYVTLSGTRVGTSTNADGAFSLKIGNIPSSASIEVSCLGYKTVTLPIKYGMQDKLTILLHQATVGIAPVVVQKVNALELVRRAMAKISENYADRPDLQSGFYRETIQKGQQYIEVSEAVTEIYRTPYGSGWGNDRTRVVKGRSLTSQNRRDTLSVKLMGGPALIVDNDYIHTLSCMFDAELLPLYSFSMEPSVALGEQVCYVVSFRPQGDIEQALLFNGTFYIDMNTLAFVRIEASVDMNDRDKVSSFVLKKKPAGLRFMPNEVSIVLSYREQQGRYYLYYARNRMRFRCDWRRRLFATNYTVVSEVVVTDGQNQNAAPFPARESFRGSHILSGRIADFYDEGFWSSYNIIEPSESLEGAVNKLLKQK